jgi:osmoprotectant transport system substrate-binding protein
MVVQRLAALIVVGGCLAASAACGANANDQPTPSALGDDAVTIGSFDFAESVLLGEVYGQALESKGIAVRREFDLGPRELVAPALDQGLVELVPEYAGTALGFFSLGGQQATADAAATHDALVKSLRGHPITALASAPAQDANTFVVTKAVAEEHGLRTLSDVAGVDDQLTFGGPPECPSRPLCLGGLQSTYHLDFDAVLTLDVAGPKTREALRDGDVDMALLFTTDPAIGSDGLVELTDDRGLQPAENVTPLVRTEVVDRWGPSLVDALDAVSSRLTTEELRNLNARATGREAAAVAREWLIQQGLL